MDEIQALVEDDPETTASFAVNEMHYGRLEWLAEHIIRCDYRINPIVARKILEMIKNLNPECLFELSAIRKTGLPPAYKDPQLTEMRNFDMAIDVARLDGFQRGHLMRACHAVGRKYNLKQEQVRRFTKKYREDAISAIADERLQAAYVRGEITFLGRPKTE